MKPTGEPDSSLRVITQTPDAWRLNACFRASVVSDIFSIQTFFSALKVNPHQAGEERNIPEFA